MSMGSLLHPFTITNPNPSFPNTTTSRVVAVPPPCLHLRCSQSPYKLPLCRPFTSKRFLSPLLAASHQESNPSEAEDSKEKSGVNEEANESEEAWKQTLALFKEKALVMQSVSQEAYEQYSKKAAVVFKEASEQLKIQAEKAKQDLSVIAKEVSEEGKEYLSKAAENPSVKDVVETFASSTEDLDEISEVRDFYLGIPYGLLLSVGGFLSFMVTGSIPAIRFGIILGGALLALSISSFQSCKRGESSSTALKGQAAIATILFLRDIRIVLVRSSLANLLTAFISGAMVAFYIYRIILEGKHTGESNSEPEKQS
ncbi:hypothetical protein ACET3Z_014075 [Daucus carota]